MTDQNPKPPNTGSGVKPSFAQRELMEAFNAGVAFARLGQTPTLDAEAAAMIADLEADVDSLNDQNIKLREQSIEQHNEQIRLREGNQELLQRIASLGEEIAALKSVVDALTRENTGRREENKRRMAQIYRAERDRHKLQGLLRAAMTTSPHGQDGLKLQKARIALAEFVSTGIVP